MQVSDAIGKPGMKGDMLRYDPTYNLKPTARRRTHLLRTSQNQPSCHCFFTCRYSTCRL